MSPTARQLADTLAEKYAQTEKAGYYFVWAKAEDNSVKIYQRVSLAEYVYEALRELEAAAEKAIEETAP